MRHTKTVRSEDTPSYHVTGATLNDDQIIGKALEILWKRVTYSTTALSSPNVVKDYLRLHLGQEQSEVFGMVYLDAKHCVVGHVDMFNGTLASCTVYPRELVKGVLEANAGAVILYHNHPSGSATPSSADMRLTQEIKKALAVVDVQVLDHLVVTARDVTSFAERGLL